MSDLSVLYDAPGPRAKTRNVVYTVVFGALLALVAGWALTIMYEENQLTWEKWGPFVNDPRVWTTYLLPGLVNTLKAAGLSVVLALPVGALLGVARLSDHWWISKPAGVIVEFFRAIPVLLMMVFASALYALYTDLPSELRSLYAVVTGLVLYNGSVIAEIVRSGILSLPYGQTDAAKAIGMRKGQTLSYVLLPQAVTAMLPALVSQLVVILKDTALGGSILGFGDLMNQVSVISTNYGSNTIATFTVVALIYIALNLLLTHFANRIEGRIRRGKKSTGAVVHGGVEEDMEYEEPGVTK